MIGLFGSVRNTSVCLCALTTEPFHIQVRVVYRLGYSDQPGLQGWLGHVGHFFFRANFILVGIPIPLVVRIPKPFYNLWAPKGREIQT